MAITPSALPRAALRGGDGFLAQLHPAPCAFAADAKTTHLFGDIAAVRTAEYPAGADQADVGGQEPHVFGSGDDLRDAQPVAEGEQHAVAAFVYFALQAQLGVFGQDFHELLGFVFAQGTHEAPVQAAQLVDVGRRLSLAGGTGAHAAKKSGKVNHGGVCTPYGWSTNAASRAIELRLSLYV